MPQGSSAVRPTNGLYTLPFSRVNLSVPTSRETDMLPAVQKSPQEATILRCVKSENDADLLTKWYNFIDTALLYWILFKIFKYLQYFTIWIIKCVTPFFVVLNTIMFWDYGVLGCDAVFIGNFKRYVPATCFFLDSATTYQIQSLAYKILLLSVAFL